MTLRRIIQSLVFLLFLLLLFQTAYQDSGEGLSPYFPSDLFLRLDPLSVFSVSLSEWSWIRGASSLILLILLTLILGRFFCGWMCPLGTTLDLFEKMTGAKPSSQRNRNPSAAPESGKLLSLFTLRSKYYLLVACLMAALLGVQAIWMVDPIPLVTRFYAIVVFPLFEWTVRGVGTMVRDWTGSTGLLRWTEEHLLSMEQPRYAYSLLTGLLFGAILLASSGDADGGVESSVHWGLY